ncbi:MAG: MurR/RpiR family transcriptional regulator [Candidatus Rokubacteria bacterium]|nr:MurR/RpiR family transcriptional regulator [Candidatus Rokubacteria bacterium]
MRARPALLEKIRSGARRLSRKQAAVAAFLAEEHQKAAFMTAAELASHLKVSEATVIRCAAALGYDGYPALRRHLHQIVQEDLTSTELFALPLRRGGREQDWLRTVVEKEIENLTRLTKELPGDDLDRLARQVVRASKVVVAGFRASASLAGFLGYHLGKIHEGVVTVTGGAGGAWDQFRSLPAPSLLLAIGFPRYPREILEAVRAELVSFVDSHCAPQAVIAALLIQVSLKNRERTEALLRRFEEIAERRRLFYAED